VTNNPPSPRAFMPEIEAELEQGILRAVARLSGERYQSAAEMLADLPWLALTCKY
jgi:hypothetical protein